VAAAPRAAPAGVPGARPAVAEAGSVGRAQRTTRAAEVLARAQLSRGRGREAERFAGRAVETGQRSGWSAGLYRLYALQARILERLGEKEAASTARGKGAAEVSKLRNQVPERLRAAFEALPAVREVLATPGATPGDRSARKEAP